MKVVDIVCIAGMAATLAGDVEAVDFLFTATPNGNWNVVANWNEGTRVPGAGDTATVKNTGTVLITQDQSASTLILGSGGNGHAELSGGTLSTTSSKVGDVGCTVTFMQTGGAHAISSWLYLAESDNASGTYHLQGGSLQALSERIGFRGTGRFIQTGGTNTVGDDLIVNTEGTPTCSYAMSNGVLSVKDRETVGAYGKGTFAQHDGIHSVGGQLRVGENATGSFAIHGGSLSATGVVYVGYSASGSYEQTGGSVAALGDVVVGKNAAGIGTGSLSGGTMTIGNRLVLGEAAGSRGAFELSGGTLTIASGIEPLAGSPSFAFLGGTLHTGFVGAGLGALTNQAGVLAPGVSIGETTFYCNYVQKPEGTLQIELDDTAIDVVKNITYATLDGRLDVVLQDGFEPEAGWISAPFLKTINGISGAFAKVTPRWSVDVSANGKELRLKRLPPNGTVVVVR